ncbi:L-type lectin-domain containing receptor kinase SIT2-like isoform X1 [Oryza glaberrima]|uniref:L-type lectin-domain containing receptor kinase SIT2-like isoform X1 n=1 Tax=Oryza glaberrima TaxID=4538 RepID=UPI00224C47D2|nr:L-type lectin-domain containing receptor kinase SIT2-like isoform X1 [Oryza glaberrima]
MTSTKLILFFLLLFLITLNLSASSTGGDHERFMYAGFTGANLTMDGSAKIIPTGLLALTKDIYQTKSHAIHPDPIRISQSNGTVRSFSVSFVFGILSRSSGSRSSHGFAFFIALTKNFSPALASQYMGLLNIANNGNLSNHLFAIEFDTVRNLELSDINDNHVGIDINSLNSEQSYYAGFYDDKSGTFTNLSLTNGGPIQVWVEYDRNTTQTNVTIAPLGIAKPMRSLVSVTHDLSTVFTNQSYLGFSSATGATTSHHYILGWSFGMNSPAPFIDSTKLPKLPGPLDSGPRTRSILLILPPIGSILLVSIAVMVVVLLARRHLRCKEVREDWEVEYGPRRFAYQDLYRATRGFKNKNLVGIGGFGKVYKGVLPISKLQVAVKRVSYDSKQGIKEFIAEVVSIGNLQHRNIVQLFGYCRCKGELLLVYDYMENGSLDKHLYNFEGQPTLDWAQRFKIIKDIASGLLYLHEDWDKVVIHRDVKASNVLIDKEMNARLGDFGLSRLCDHGSNLHTTNVVGTIGYLAPELIHTGKATTLSDVFGFGIFLLEVACGQKPIKINSEGSHLVLADWVVENWHKGSFLDTMDTRLQGQTCGKFCNTSMAM